MNLKNASVDSLWIDYKTHPTHSGAERRETRKKSSLLSRFALPRLTSHRPSLFGSSKIPTRGAVRITSGTPGKSHNRGKMVLLALTLTAGASILASTAMDTSDKSDRSFKAALLTSADIAPAIPTFRFDDADSIIDDTMQTAQISANLGRPTSQGFAPQAFASLLSDLDQFPAAKEDVLDESAANAIALPPLAPRLSAQALAPLKKEELKQNFKKVVLVESGDSFYRILEKKELSIGDINTIMQDDLVKEHLTSLRIGDKVEFDHRWNGDLASISVKVNRDTRVAINRDAFGGYDVVKTHLPLEYERVVTSGTIDESLYVAAQEANLKQSTIMELADIFEWELDFARDIRKGDSFSIVYDRLYRDSKYVGDGDILAAEFVRGDRHYRAIRFTDDNGRTDYYSPNGQTKRRSFMRHPVDVVRITSHFNPNRLHPVLHKIRAHKGVDYGAPHGSPIKATADGTIAFSGDKNAYGNTVILKHGDNISTLYAHMSRIANKSKKGVKVRRGDIIGYVGKTGRVTGTHLHYEFRINNKHVDPLKVELPMAAALDKKYLPKLKAVSQELIAQMRSVLPTQKVATSQ